MQKLINEEWVDCTEQDLIEGDFYRIPVGGDIQKGTNGWQAQEYRIEPEE